MDVFDHIPVLGAGLGYQDELHAEIVAHRDAIDFLEIPTDQFLRQIPEWNDRLREIKDNFATVAHGVYMSLGDAGGAHVEYLDRLIPYLDTLDPFWFSDHIDMGNIPGDDLGMYFHGMQVPFTHEQAAVFRRNMQVFSDRVRRPLLVENIFYKFVFPMPNGLSEPAFIREILKDSDWGLLLDVTNVYINALNFDFDPYAWLEQAPLERTVEIHIAGGELRTSGDWQGKWADTHSQPVPDAVWRMLEYVVARAPVKAVLLERDQNYPPIQEMLAELDIARGILASSQRGPNVASARPAVAER
ncbi:MAG TPA: DUF692 domain-containing protein [Chloroflexota bacterium]|nr:DUF692 domain-containing protein [Chloroflexota bacterium]